MNREQRDLVEKVALAAGHDPLYWVENEGLLCETLDATPRYFFNPLEHDGDALRLAVKLRISLVHEQEYMSGPVVETIEALSPQGADGSRHCEAMFLNEWGADEMANTRIAIVRAAAAIADAKNPPTP
jgi:hypothetical protein